MRTSSLVLMVMGITLTVSSLSVWFYPSVKDFMQSNTFWNGIRDFSDEYKVNNIDSLDALTDKAQNSVLVAIPDTEYNTPDLLRIKQFVEAGNTLLLMDDFGYGNEVLQYLGLEARFDHNLLLDPLFCYKNEYLPRIVDFSPEVKSAGIEAIVLNHATVLDNIGSTQALAWSSIESFLDLNQNGTKDINEPAGPLVTAAEIKVGRGTVELVSDPSIIINSIIGQNDNHKFIGYLAARNGAPADYLLDGAHLNKALLDEFKIRWNSARGILTNPYVTLGLIVVVFLIVIRYTLTKGDLLG